MKTNLFPQNQMVAPVFDLKSIYQTVLKSVFTVFLLLCSMGVSGQVNITPVRTDVSGFASWTDATVTGTTYLQLSAGTSSTISPAMDFTPYTTTTLDFKARTFGGTSGSSNVITVSISTNNGGSWTVLGTRTPTTNTLTAVTQFSLSAYTGLKLK